jgi:hypothetical protein
MQTLERGRALTLLMAVAALLLPLLPWSRAASAAEQSVVKTEAQLDEEWATTATDLVRRAAAGGHRELATLISGWQLPDEGERQFVLVIPAVPPQAAPIPAEIGTSRPRLERRSRCVGPEAGRGAAAGREALRRRARSWSVASRSRVPMALPATCMATLASRTAAAIQPARPSQPIAAQAIASTTANQE